VIGKQKDYDYYDTTLIQYPVENSYLTNRIFFKFANSQYPDSILLVVTKSNEKNLFWKQIFLSTVIIEQLNKFSSDPAEFRINENTLVEPSLLDDNDTLIYKVLNYFELNKGKLKLGDCGTNSEVFRDICIKFNLPCRIVGLQGGDAQEDGFFNDIGYPSHAICEIYSSKHKKWYIIDPSYGLRFKNSGSDDYLNSIEVSNMLFFQREKFIVQDSVLSTMRTTMERDYFKYYENIYFVTDKKLRRPLSTILQLFFNKFGYNTFHYTNHLVPFKNGFYYAGIKFFIYLFFIILYFNAALTIMTRRLFSAKKPKHFINDRKYFHKEKQEQEA
jgi:hypothetical protein